MTKCEIIQETVDWYSEDLNRRAIVYDLCFYYSACDNKMCAVGRCLIDPKPLAHDNKAIVDLMRCKTVLDEHFKEQYRGHGPEFWLDLQSLHDEIVFWGEDNGLSVIGQKHVNKLMERYKEDGKAGDK